ncbi:hypothetical protein LTR36_008102 [Oleoguttula mirabilis]|uniref:Glycosyltransferase family 8 protein n=1 Tax=Oleoguttula mirabilis TaxID=1507867 RepID=A0AAV9J8D6_9PEZI|nr:hypothetical protein LTR36_008102 [Oleoguttula mirabilis]
MGRILLSQSQVSVVASSAVILIFTVLLFLSGYVIQQRTVTGLQAAIKPRIPQPPPSLHVQQQDDSLPELRPSRLFKGKGRVAYTKLDAAAQAGANVDWKRLAHVQLVRTHHDVCNAVMVLAEFHRLKSPARRVLLFPTHWAQEKEGKKGDISDPFLSSSRRLMRMAARRYGVELRPVSPVITSAEAEDESKDVYSLASAFALTDLDRVLSIETPGLLVDAMPLDAVLAFTESAPFAMLQETAAGDDIHSEDLLLLQPSGPTHAELLERVSAEPSFNDTLFPTIFTDPLLLASSTDDQALIRSIGTLHDAARGFNATAYLSGVSYIRFSDPKLPGPEYDVPWSQKVAARPKNKDADWTWTKLYGQFAQKRMDVCGLDLETWRG